MNELTHLDDQGRARMVDVTDKKPSVRVASASGALRCAFETLEKVRSGTAPKGSVVGTAEIAGIMAAKRTAELIPLCHPLPLGKVEVRITIDEALPGFRVEADVRTQGSTGVEMEALTAVTVACLTLFDMLKGVDRTMVIGEVQVTAKSGGKSGSWQTS